MSCARLQLKVMEPIVVRRMLMFKQHSHVVCPSIIGHFYVPLNFKNIFKFFVISIYYFYIFRVFFKLQQQYMLIVKKFNTVEVVLFL